MKKRRTVDGTKFLILTEGAGEALVFLHGGFMTHEVWEGQLDHFAANYRVITFDQRGYGESDMPKTRFTYHEDLVHLLDALKIRQAVLIGSSFGGGVAIDFAIAYPERVKGLILCAPVVNGFVYPFLMKYHSITGAANVRQFGPEEGADRFMRNRFWRYFVPKDDLARQRFREIFIANSLFSTWDHKLVTVLHPYASKRLGEIAAPTLIIDPEMDARFNHKACGYAKRFIPHAELVTMKNCGHLAHFEDPVEFNRIVRGFLDKIGITRHEI